MLTLVLVGAMLLDNILGEPRRWHPLVGFGRWVRFIERRLYPTNVNDFILLVAGTISWFIVVTVPLVSIIIAIHFFKIQPGTWSYLFISMWVVYLAIAPRSLAEHAIAIERPLLTGNLDEAREKLGYIVSRDTQALDQNEIAKATVESVIENSHDAVIAPIFWFLIAGLPGVLLFRMVNTLDAMWGYRTRQYNFFGRMAARMDDVMGYVSARITVLLFALQKPKAILVAWRDARKWYSPNAGPVMAAGAGALDLAFGGSSMYDGALKDRPTLGYGSDPTPKDIDKALRLTTKSYWWLIVMVAVFEGVAYAFGPWW